MLAGGAPVALVVDDDDLLREMVCELLEEEGLQPVGCDDGEQAIRLARELNPSVIALDLYMPGMHGIDVLESLSSDTATAEFPVVVVSVDQLHPRVGAFPQVAAVLQKPFACGELVRRAQMAIEASGGKSPIQAVAV